MNRPGLVNLVLRLATAMVLVGIIVPVVWLMQQEPDTPRAEPTPVAAHFDAAPTATQMPTVPPLETFAVIWERSIDARAWVDTTSQAMLEMSGSRDWPPPIELMGIAVEGEHARAILEVDGEVKIAGEGEIVGDCQVRTVTPCSVTLHSGGRTVTLVLPEE